MSSINKKEQIFTFEGASSNKIPIKKQLERTVLSCMLWEDRFYEDGVSISDRINALCDKLSNEDISEIAIRARTEQYLRHVPLLLVRNMSKKGGRLVSETLSKVICRPDEITEFLAIYWKDGKTPISAQIKKGISNAFNKFNEYELAKWNKDGKIKLRDALFLCHAKPESKEKEDLFKKLAENELETPDTWEVCISDAKNEDKKSVWEDLLYKNKLGGLALLRNLNNFKKYNVDKEKIKSAIKKNKFKYVLPFRFIQASKYYPELEAEIEEAMLKSLSNHKKLSGKTAILVDHSLSMKCELSENSNITLFDAACGLAIIAREICEDILILSFSEKPVVVPNRRGFALRDAIHNSQEFWGTDIQCAKNIADHCSYDRIIIITDEQSMTPLSHPLGKGLGYIINVSTYRNGIGYGAWTHIDGWSEKCLDYIIEKENRSFKISQKK